jgi:hypothetical protein
MQQTINASVPKPTYGAPRRAETRQEAVTRLLREIESGREELGD